MAPKKIRNIAIDNTPSLDDIVETGKNPDSGTPLSRHVKFRTVLALLKEYGLELPVASPPDGGDYVLLVRDPEGTPALEVATLDEILALGGGGGGGGLTMLEEHVAAGSASLDFDDWRNDTLYDAYEIHFENLVSASNSILYVRVSTDGGSSYISTASYNWLITGGYSTNSFTVSGAGTSAILGRETNTTLAGGGSFNGRLRLVNPGGTTVYKSFLGDVQWLDNSIGLVSATWAGTYNATTAVNAFQVLMASGNITSGTVRIYGIPKAA